MNIGDLSRFFAFMAQKKHTWLGGNAQKNKLLPYFLIFQLAFILFFLLQNQLTFADPDSFYHAKMAVLMKDGIVADFPWLQYTVLRENYADHHLLYHALLVPFVWVFPPLLGTKVATVLFASMAVTVFYWFLRKMRVYYPFLYTAILIVSASFVFRINLAKAQSLALAAFFISFYLIDRKKYALLFVVSFLYVWLYGGWPLLILLALVYAAVDFFKAAKLKRTPPFFFYAKEHLILLTQKNAKLMAVVISGIAVGLIANPYFPQNLFFYWHQIVQIAVINYKSIIGVGGEWYPYNPFELIASASIAFVVGILGLTFFALNYKNSDKRTVAFFILFAGFFVLTLKSRRNVEYLIPIMLAFSGMSLSRFSETINSKGFYKEVVEFFRGQRLLLLGACVPLLVLPYVVVRDYLGVRKSYSEGIPFTKLQKSSEWLKANTRAGAIVFHSDWDEFPVLFYNNSHNYYIVGLDPTFMYDYNQDLYWKWKNATIGEEKAFLHSIIKKDFRADYVFVSTDRHKAFENTLENNFYFEEVYVDSESKIYKVL